MTFFELLKKYPIEELWYILEKRHELSRKPLSAERMYARYKLAYKELLALHSGDNPNESILICVLSIDNEDKQSGTPEIWVHCNLLSLSEDSGDELQEFALDLIPWRELIDCTVSEESIAKLGGLICAAELLWKITFYGFTEQAVADASEELQKILDDIDSGAEKTTPWNSDEYKRDKEEVASEEEALKAWLVAAPAKVKELAHSYFVGTVSSRDEESDEISVDETILRLKLMLDECSAGGDAECIEYVSMLNAMLRNLDIDERYALVSVMFTSEI